MRLLVEVSARHCHLSREKWEELDPQGYMPLSVAGEFATESFLVENGKKFRIVGPARDRTYCEVAHSELRNWSSKLAEINPPHIHLDPLILSETKAGQKFMETTSNIYLPVSGGHLVKALIKYHALNHQVVGPGITGVIHLDTDWANALGYQGREVIEISN